MITLGTKADDTHCDLPISTLLRHVVALGASGSGKTVASKVICEEVVRKGMPVIAIDPQGDIASLIQPNSSEELVKHGVDPALLEDYCEKVEVCIFTPASNAGIPMSCNPLGGELSDNPLEMVMQCSNIAGIITGIVGYGEGTQGAQACNAVICEILERYARQGAVIRDLKGLQVAISGQSEYLKAIAKSSTIADITRRIARLQVGAAKLIFEYGHPMSIEYLITPFTEGKTRISVIYLNTLANQSDKTFFVATLANLLYSWMLKHPSNEPQLLFYLDEIAPYLPPVKMPASKPILRLLFKQARKYGVCCLMATQNPGDIDYKSLSQFSTWLIGRIITRQDIAKIQGMIQSLAPNDSDKIISTLPRLTAGNFILLSPDAFEHPVRLKTRWLLTQHNTLPSSALEEFHPTPERDDARQTITETIETSMPANVRKPSLVAALLPPLLALTILGVVAYCLLT